MREYMRMYRRAHPHLSTRYVRTHRERKRRLAQRLVEQEIRQQVRVAPSAQSAVYSVSILGCVVWGFSTVKSTTITFEALQTFIRHSAVTTVEVMGLFVIGMFCWRHVRDLWREMK